MASQHVLRVRRTDDPSAHLLVQVTQTSKTRPLDLKLVATEHEHLYHGSVKSTNLVALQANNYRGDDDEWRSVVASAMLQERSDANLDALQGLETVAAIKGETCTLTLRKNIGGIIQRLGSIKLTQDDEKEEVSAFEWVDTAVAASDGLRSELMTLQASLGSQQAQVAQLTEQLDQLLTAKKEHEEQLLRKCAVLLDSKRAKIRDQQSELNALADGRSKDKADSVARKAGGSGRGKRKASHEDVEEEDEGADDADDLNGDEDDLVEEEEEGQRTPDHETEDEASDDGFAPPVKAPSQGAPSQKRGNSATGTAKDLGTLEDVDVEDLPPRRELPFARRNKESQQKPPSPAPALEEDDTDDEL